MTGKEKGNGTSSPNCSDAQGKGGESQNEERATIEIDSAHDEGANRRWETT